MDATTVMMEIAKMGSIPFLMALVILYMKNQIEERDIQIAKLNAQLLEIMKTSTEQTVKNTFQTEIYNKTLENIPSILANAVEKIQELFKQSIDDLKEEIRRK